MPWTVARISGVDVFSGRRLRKYLRAQARARREQRLTREEQHPERIAHAAARRKRRRPPARHDRGFCAAAGMPTIMAVLPARARAAAGTLKAPHP